MFNCSKCQRATTTILYQWDQHNERKFGFLCDICAGSYRGPLIAPYETVHEDGDIALVKFEEFYAFISQTVGPFLAKMGDKVFMMHFTVETLRGLQDFMQGALEKVEK